MAVNKTSQQGQTGKAGAKGDSKNVTQKQSGGASRKSSMNDEEKGSSSSKGSNK